MNDVKVSVIIPCYNTGEYLIEAIESVCDSGFEDFEIIVVNDGSTETKTLAILKSLDYPRTQVIDQDNKGLAAARNSGVHVSSGELLFFLDSDNKVRRGYFEEAFVSFDADESIGVVYSRPSFFGESTVPRFYSRDFNFDALLAGNYIDACAFVRRKAFDEIGGFDENRSLRISEDWDFWIRMGQTSWKFHFLDDMLFDYRIRNNSMIGVKDQGGIDTTLKYFGSKHGYVIHRNYRRYYKLMQKIEQRPFTYFFKILYNRYILKKSILD